MDAIEFAERHQEQMMITKADDFRERFTAVMSGFDAANFANGGGGAFGFNDKTD